MGGSPVDGPPPNSALFEHRQSGGCDSRPRRGMVGGRGHLSVRYRRHSPPGTTDSRRCGTLPRKSRQVAQPQQHYES
jgi:hypothetical protein